jgi:hypothetical protein
MQRPSGNINLTKIGHLMLEEQIALSNRLSFAVTPKQVPNLDTATAVEGITQPTEHILYESSIPLYHIILSNLGKTIQQESLHKHWPMHRFSRKQTTNILKCLKMASMAETCS